MGLPASRVTDLHICVAGIVADVVTDGASSEAGTGPVLPPCSGNVFTGMLPQARMTDEYFCIILQNVFNLVSGSPTVFVNGLPACRIGDATMCGGALVTGFPTVLIG
jgi:uncharacterized Zn-binding protein involved in type VI secretion